MRAVGAVTHAICASEPGAVLGVRGPFGNSWPVEAAAGGDVVVVAGGIGLAPLRPVVLYDARAARASFGAVSVLYGARTPADLLYTRRARRAGAHELEVEVTVDAADTAWTGRVGVVPKLIEQARVPTRRRRRAFVCGPEIMMRFTVEALLERGVPAERIYVSMERNMQLRRRPLRPLPARPDADLPRRPGLPLGTRSRRCMEVREL